MKTTQEQYPKQAMKRTAAAILTAIPLAIAILIGAAESLNVINEHFNFKENITEMITAASVLLITIATVITRILAIPAVNTVLKKIGLGSEPKNALSEAERILAEAEALKEEIEERINSLENTEKIVKTYRRTLPEKEENHNLKG